MKDENITSLCRNFENPFSEPATAREDYENTSSVQRSGNVFPALPSLQKSLELNSPFSTSLFAHEKNSSELALAKAVRSNAKSGVIDHLYPEQIDHP